MSYEKLYQISFFVATLFAFTTYSSNLETIERVYSAKNEAKTSTGVLETKTDGKEYLSKTIQASSNSGTTGTANTTPVSSVPIGNVKTLATVPKLTSVKTVKTSTIGHTETGSLSKKIYRNGWNDPCVQYAYDISGGDMDFIKIIEAESKWDVNALGDKGKSFGLCQIHKGYNPAMQKAYRALKTDNEKVKMCYDQYKDWVKRGVIKTRLYGFNVRNKPQNKNSFTIY